ncbi:unnamed protein product [Kuraishia capsulata CBS 1993]|uniref:Nucleoporin NDC1 n=1 Tax=Kuraishia capsulata CBS 1993 TaxID=1382522 RepID=W6MXQ8_9ASCO|nr:uncharacterized protein KUCA_T00005303001 [Kuraishia capsulata CBS 1993]CDK29315.1 unnamed protein product [Kuraishia capsulata CBS 1993]
MAAGPTSASASKSSGKPVYYSSIVTKTHHKRLTYFWRLSLVLTGAVTFSTVLGARASIWSILPKFFFIWVGFAVVKYSRDITLQIGSPGYKTLISQLCGELVTSNMLTCLMAYLFSGGLFFSSVYVQFSSLCYYVASPTKTVKPSINDQFVYFWFYSTLFAVSYAVQQLVLEKNRLQFQHGVYREEPEPKILAGIKPSLVFGAYFSGVLSLALPIVYLVLRTHIYGVWLKPFCWVFGLNTHKVAFDVSFSLIFKIFLASVFLSSSWEIINHIFDAYASIGCLHKGQPLSSQSDDPANTLLSGLRDVKNPLARVTAFQELAFLATSKDSSHRSIFYNGRFKHSFVWSSILEECTVVIKANSNRMKKNLQEQKKTQKLAPAAPKHESNLFGNSRHMAATTNDPDDTSIFDTSGLFPSSQPKDVQARLRSAAQEDAVPPVPLLKDLEEQLRPYLTTLKTYYNEFLASGLGIPFITTIAREASSRVKNPSITGNAMITIAYVTTHAITEDKKNVVGPTLPEVLELLEMGVNASSEFLEFCPVPFTSEEASENVISDLHNLALRLFFDLTVKFNASLNDLILTPNVFKLAKWCIDLAIDQQRMEQEDVSQG